MTISGTAAHPRRVGVLTWLARLLAVVALVVVGWCLVAAWPAIVHGHPAYWVLLALTVIGAILVGLRSLRPRRRPRRVLRTVLIVLAAAWIGVIWWLQPMAAQQPALAAMTSDSRVQVTESATWITFLPRSDPSHTAVFFQPGAKVDARAYAAVLRPLAEDGYLVVIPKQPLGIGFLAFSAFTDAKADHPSITRWVVGGHSLGGTVAAIDADAHDADARAPVVGLLLYASYPATDLHDSLTARVLSISGSDDGLATPAKIRATKSLLPASTEFVVIHGGVHAFFGDYGAQPGDGTPTISHAQARAQISALTLSFVRALSR